MAYTKQTWTNDVSKLNATRMQYIEDGLEAAAIVADAAIPESLVDAKGDLLVGSAADTAARQAVGANNTLVVADSAQTNGIKWAQLTNAMVDAAAAITYSKLNLAGAIVNADIAANAAIAQSKIAEGWTTIVKAANEAVTSSTTLQNDDDFLFVAANGTTYEIEFLLIYASPNVGNTPGLKMAFGEDATNTRGSIALQYVSADTPAVSQVLTDQATTVTSGTNAIKRLVVGKGYHTGAGGTFRMLWAQGTSDTDATTLYRPSQMRYRAIA